MSFGLSLLRPVSRLRRALATGAALVLLATALAPGISRLLDPARQDAWNRLCQVRADGSTPAGTSAPGAHAGDACALCVLAHTTPLLEAPAAFHWAGSAATAIAPRAPAPVAIATLKGRAANARAPPRFG